MVAGGSNIREAYLILQDFTEKYPMIGMVLKCEGSLLYALGKLWGGRDSIAWSTEQGLHWLHSFCSNGTSESCEICFLFSFFWWCIWCNRVTLIFYSFAVGCKRSRNSCQSNCMQPSPLGNHHQDPSGMKCNWKTYMQFYYYSATPYVIVYAFSCEFELIQ